MGKKNRNKKDRRKKQLDSNPITRWSITLLDVRKELDLEQRNDDIITSLPDDILCHIISFLPFKSAVQTSFLSTRWKDLWKRNFSVREGTIDDAFTAISSFLRDFSDQFQQPATNCGFQLNVGKGSFLSVAIEPDKALHLDFSNVKHEFPWRFDWLLAINDPVFTLFDLWMSYFDRNPQSSPFLFKLKTLHLVSVSHLSCGAISSMMPNFKFLENLAIEKCKGLRSLRIKAGHARLKKLTILDCQQLESIQFQCHTLHSLRYRGKLVSFEFRHRPFWYFPWDNINRIPLEDAMLDFREGPGCSNISSSCQFMNSIFHRMNGVKSLTLCRWVFEAMLQRKTEQGRKMDDESDLALICPLLLSPPSSWGFQLNQLTELWWIDYSKQRYNSNALICLLKICPRLRRLYITIDHKSYRRVNTTKCSVEVPRLPRLEDLKFVKLEGFPNEKEEIALARRLKQEFNVEPLIIAKSNYLNCVRILVKDQTDHKDELQKEGKDSYKFVETRVEHLGDLCPKHVHMCF